MDNGYDGMFQGSVVTERPPNKTGRLPGDAEVVEKMTIDIQKAARAAGLAVQRADVRRLLVERCSAPVVRSPDLQAAVDAGQVDPTLFRGVRIGSAPARKNAATSNADFRRENPELYHRTIPPNDPPAAGNPLKDVTLGDVYDGLKSANEIHRVIGTTMKGEHEAAQATHKDLGRQIRESYAELGM